MRDVKQQWPQIENDMPHKTPYSEGNRGNSSLLNQNSAQEKDRKVDAKSKRTNPWRSKKPLHNDGPFTVKYPETQLADFIDDYDADMGRYPMGSFYEFLESTNPIPMQWGRPMVKELEDSGEQDQWWSRKRRASPYMTKLVEKTGICSQPNDASVPDFQSLGLSDNQILGLRNLGFQIPYFNFHTNPDQPEDPRIPPSFEIAGALCWWCESAEHVSYGVARLLEDDPAFVGIDLECRVRRNSERYSQVALIQIAKIDTVLLIPTNFQEHSTPKALHILFQDPNIVKVGVKVEYNLRKLWRDIEIDANCYVELNELIPYSRSDFGSMKFKPTKRLGLETMSDMLGYTNLRNREIASSNWEKLPLSWDQLHYAALEALLPTRIFWRILMGSEIDAMKPISAGDLRANIETFVKPVCKRVPISLLDKEQIITKSKQEELDLGCSWEHPYYRDAKVMLNPGSLGRSSLIGDSIRGDSFGFQGETHATASRFKPEAQLEEYNVSNFSGYYNERVQRFGNFPGRRNGENDTASKFLFQNPQKTYYSTASPDCETGEDYTNIVKNRSGFNLPFDVALDLVN